MTKESQDSIIIGLIVICVVFTIIVFFAYPIGRETGYYEGYWNAFLDYKNGRLEEKIKKIYPNRIMKYYNGAPNKI